MSTDSSKKKKPAPRPCGIPRSMLLEELRGDVAKQSGQVAELRSQVAPGTDFFHLELQQSRLEDMADGYHDEEAREELRAIRQQMEQLRLRRD